MSDIEYLSVLLTWVITGGASWASSEICEVWPWFQKLAHVKAKIVVAVLVSSLIGSGAYTLSVIMLYAPAPTDWRGWVSAIIGAAIVSSGFGKLMHNVRRKRLSA